MTPNPKLTRTNVDEIIELRKTGLTLASIASRFGVSPQYIHSLCKQHGIRSPRPQGFQRGQNPRLPRPPSQ